jgi:hypothetical protein
MLFDSRPLLAGVISFALGRIGILHALRVHDAEARRGLPPVVLAFLRHLIFLKPAQAGCGSLPQGFDSIDQSSSVPYRAKENRQARRAMSPRSSTGTGSRKKYRTGPAALGKFSSSLLQAMAESVRIAPG